MSHDFWKFMVHDFLKINVPRFFEIHSPRFFEIHSPRFFGIQCPTIFCDFGLFNSLAQAGGGGPYYMIFHYQKHTVLNYLWVCQLPCRHEQILYLTLITIRGLYRYCLLRDNEVTVIYFSSLTLQNFNCYRLFIY